MKDERMLTSLKDKLERVKQDLNEKKGEFKSVLLQLSERFDVKDLEGARKKFDVISGEIESKQERRTELLEQAEERLEGYV